MKPLIELVPILLNVDEWMNRLAALVETEFGVRVLCRDRPIDLSAAFDPVRKQYSSSAILLQLIDPAPSDARKILGVTDVDLFIPVLTYVFGEAQLGGIGAVVSMHRLKDSFYGLSENNDRLTDRLVKEAVHELGHTFGLFHCNRIGCVMNASTYVEDIDQKSERFCGECRRALEDGVDGNEGFTGCDG